MRSEEERFKEAAELFLGFIACLLYEDLPDVIAADKWVWVEDVFTNPIFDFLSVENIKNYQKQQAVSAWEAFG